MNCTSRSRSFLIPHCNLGKQRRNSITAVNNCSPLRLSGSTKDLLMYTISHSDSFGLSKQTTHALPQGTLRICKHHRADCTETSDDVTVDMVRSGP